MRELAVALRFCTDKFVTINVKIKPAFGKTFFVLHKLRSSSLMFINVKPPKGMLFIFMFYCKS